MSRDLLVAGGIKDTMKKKILAGVLAVLVITGGIGSYIFSQQRVRQVQVIEAEKTKVEKIVNTTGTVESEEKKTYYSPVNAELKAVDFEQGDIVKKGTKLIEFNTESLEKDNQKAEMNLKSTQYDSKDTLNKSDENDKKIEEAQESIPDLEQKITNQKAYIRSLEDQITAVQKQAESASAAQSAAQSAAEAKAQEEAAQAKIEAQEKQQKAIQEQYQKALNEYRTETLPKYQKKLSDLNSRYVQAQSEYSRADMEYQMAFSAWQADPSDENAAALDECEAARSEALIGRDQAKEAYEDFKNQKPEMPTLSDFTSGGSSSSSGDEFSDGSSSDFDEDSSGSSDSGSSSYSTGSSVTANTTNLERALSDAQSDLSELQTKLQEAESTAENTSGSMTTEQKEKLKITDNLSELEAKSAKELVEEGRKGISAEFNGIISEVKAEPGATVSQGTELFTIQNTENVSVDVTMSKEECEAVEEGQKASITIVGHTYTGTVTKISHMAVKNSKGTAVISAKVSIDEPDEDVFFGIDASVEIHGSSNAIKLPVEAVNIQKDNSYCYVVSDGVTVRRNVTVGSSQDGYVEIVSGLSEGESVVADLENCKEGTKVEGIS